MFSSKCETFAIQVACAWVAELSSKWGAQVHVKKLENFCDLNCNCDVTSTEIWRHYILLACLRNLKFDEPSTTPIYTTRYLLLRSEIPSGMCAKLRTVAASNNRVHMPWSLYYCSFAPHICMVLFFRHIPFVVNHTFNATQPERLQHYHTLHWLEHINVTSCSYSYTKTIYFYNGPNRNCVT